MNVDLQQLEAAELNGLGASQLPHDIEMPLVEAILGLLVILFGTVEGSDDASPRIASLANRAKDDPNSTPIEPAELPNVPAPAEPYLNGRQAFDYNDFRGAFLDWLRTAGKNPEREIGLAAGTVENYDNRTDQFLRWVWEEFGGYTTNLRRDHADRFVEALATDAHTQDNGQPYAGSSKRKLVDAVRKLYEWRARERGGPDWETDVTFDERRTNHADNFTIGERHALREAALELDSVPAYGDVSPEERDRWKAHLAQKLGKPKAEVSPADWDRLNRSWEIPTLIWTALDAGLRPIEVERSTIDWLRLEKAALFIPKSDAAKNRNHWEVSLQARTADALERWLDQRENYEKYDGSRAIWLNQQGNPYNSSTLNHLLGKLMDQAGIDETNRQLVWYSIRHSLGTSMSNRGGLEQAKAQLRHESLESTLQYTHPSLEDRRDTLDELG